MRFLVDESVDASIARRLREDGHATACVWELEPGASDETILARADRNKSVLVTADKDFGELVYRLGQAHNGVLLVRLAGLPPDKKAAIVSEAVREHGAAMTGAFMVVTATLVRLRVRSVSDSGPDM